jgi:hypothetical protein
MMYMATNTATTPLNKISPSQAGGKESSKNGERMRRLRWTTAKAHAPPRAKKPKGRPFKKPPNAKSSQRSESQKAGMGDPGTGGEGTTGVGAGWWWWWWWAGGHLVSRSPCCNDQWASDMGYARSHCPKTSTHRNPAPVARLSNSVINARFVFVTRQLTLSILPPPHTPYPWSISPLIPRFNSLHSLLPILSGTSWSRARAFSP